MSRRGLFALIPFGVGLVVSFLLNITLTPNPIIYLRADLGTLLLLGGTLLSLILVVSLWLKKREAQLVAHNRQQAVQERLRFVGRLDHELKNPITAILAGLANLATHPTPTQKKTLESVTAQVQRLRRLTADLRKLSDLETRPIETAPVDFNDLLEDVFTFAQDQPTAQNRHMTLSIPRAPWPLSTVFGDRDLLLLAFYNLLDNALKFTDPTDTIEMRAFETNATLIVEVADTGPGIITDELSQVWEELYRGHTAQGIPGSGLGLALVRAIIRRHQGEVTLRSRPQQGTVVAVTLPLHQVAEP